MERKKIREFYCRTCNKNFSVLAGKDEEIKCPYCNGKDLVKVPKVLKRKEFIACKCNK